jgi:hypothetical protein
VRRRKGLGIGDWRERPWRKSTFFAKSSEPPERTAASRSDGAGLRLKRGFMIHKIPTEAPEAAEVFWHERFRAKRKGGEWFALSPADVKTFRRCKSM